MGPIWIPPKAFIHILSASSGRQLSSAVCIYHLFIFNFNFQVKCSDSRMVNISRVLANCISPAFLANGSSQVSHLGK